MRLAKRLILTAFLGFSFISLAHAAAVDPAAYVASKEGVNFHKPSCGLVVNITPENKIIFKTKEEAQKAGYKPCGVCNP